MDDHKAYEAYLRDTKDSSDKTVQNYISDLRACGSYNINGILAYIRASKTKATRARRYYSMKSYLRFLAKSGVEVPKLEDHIDPPKWPKGMPKPIPTKQYQDLVELVLSSQDLREDERLVLLLLSDTGRRVNEILSLRAEDVVLDTHPVTGRNYFRIYLKVKGGSVDTTFIAENARSFSFLTNWVEYNQGVFVFPELNYNHLHYTWNKRVSGVYNMHRIRHTVATDLVNRDGYGLETAQAVLGHRSITTTYRYAEVSKRKVMQIMEAMQSS